MLAVIINNRDVLVIDPRNSKEILTYHDFVKMFGDMNRIASIGPIPSIGVRHGGSGYEHNKYLLKNGM